MALDAWCCNTPWCNRINPNAEGRELLQRLPAGTRILVGYVNAGRVTRTRSLDQAGDDIAELEANADALDDEPPQPEPPGDTDAATSGDL